MMQKLAALAQLRVKGLLGVVFLFAFVRAGRHDEAQNTEVKVRRVLLTLFSGGERRK